jgi:coenzyme F420-0:L-glutamate ligase / coenzyme F420-1:gamma-L-glutamate ligase
MQGEIRVIPLYGIAEVRPGDDLAAMIIAALAQQQLVLADHDILVVTQKIVSKAEGQLVDPTKYEPSHIAQMAAAQGPKDAHYYEVALREAKRVIRMDRGVLVTETHHGFICANSGVDESNVDGGRLVTLLPKDPDGSAASLRAALNNHFGTDSAVIISDTFGRAWREGQVNFAVGVAGIAPLTDYAGVHDPHGYELRVSKIAIADELAAAAELVMGKVDGVPVAVIRGYHYASVAGGYRELLRVPEKDLFR